MTSAVPELQTKPATLLTPRVILAMCFWGLLLVVPVVASFLIVSVLRFGVLTFVIPLLTIAGLTFFLPLGFGNSYVLKLFRPLRPAQAQPDHVFFVQLTCQPRSRSGLLALLEDADDLGFMSFTESGLVFEGDSIRLSVPYNRVRELGLENAGWRALFAYGPRTVFSVAGLEERSRFAFAERSSWHLPGSRKNARQLFQNLQERVRGAG